MPLGPFMPLERSLEWASVVHIFRAPHSPNKDSTMTSYAKHLAGIALCAMALGGCDSKAKATPMTQTLTTQTLSPCVTLASFDASDSAWRSVNDNVMGGRSDGAFSLENDHMIFEGFINTNGGGFASVRKPLEPNRLVGQEVIALRVRSQNPQLPYRVSFNDGSMRSVSFTGFLGLSASTDWQEVEVSLSALKASRFGRPMDVPFKPEDMRSLGLILSHKQDTPFKLEVDWIKACKESTAS